MVTASMIKVPSGVGEDGTRRAGTGDGGMLRRRHAACQGTREGKLPLLREMPQEALGAPIRPRSRGSTTRRALPAAGTPRSRRCARRRPGSRSG